MMEHLLHTYIHTYGKRFTRRQKRAFGNALLHDMKEAGYDGERKVGKHLIFRAENYIFGNLKTAKRVIMVPYDTPERKFWFHVPYYPLHGMRTSQKTMKATYLPLIILYLFIFLGLKITDLFTSPMLVNTVAFLMFLFVLFLIYVMFHGIGNKHNAIRNSSSICTAVALAKRLSKDEKRQTVFIFTDKNKYNFLGTKCIQELFEKQGKNPIVIMLDCVGAQGDVYIGYAPHQRKIANECLKAMKGKTDTIEVVKMNENMRMQHTAGYFKKVIVVCTGEKDKDQEVCVYDTGTRKDKTVSLEQMKTVEDMLYLYIKQS